MNQCMCLLVAMLSIATLDVQAVADSLIIDDGQQCIAKNDLLHRKQKLNQSDIDNLNQFRVSEISKEVILVDVSDQTLPLPINGVVKSSLTGLKTKTYLMKQSLLLIGNGFDDEKLMLEASHLELFGFEKVRVLERGLRSVKLSEFMGNAKLSQSFIPAVDASVAISAIQTSKIAGEYVLFFLDKEPNSYQDLGADFISLNLDVEEKNQYQGIYDIYDSAMSNNKHVKIVAVLDEAINPTHLLKNVGIEDLSNFWAIHGGRSSFFNVWNSSKIDPSRERNTRSACGR